MSIGTSGCESLVVLSSPGYFRRGVLASTGGVTFTDVAEPSVGITWERTPSARHSRVIQMQLDSLATPITFDDILTLPAQSPGLPGVALLDYDMDGDLDIYAPNGPGAPSSLFSNQLVETGQFGFIDMAAAAGVTATAQDSAGTCFGDIDNDGDQDLFIVGSNEPHILYENLGNGTFADISAWAGLGDGGFGGSSCSLGDVNHDGLLDLAVGHTWDQLSQIPCFVPFLYDNHDELFINAGNNTFVDASATSGIEVLGGFPAYAAGSAAPTLAVALVDYDLDGDADYFAGSDQCGVTPAALGGVDRGHQGRIQPGYALVQRRQRRFRPCSGYLPDRLHAPDHPRPRGRRSE